MSVQSRTLQATDGFRPAILTGVGGSGTIVVENITAELMEDLTATLEDELTATLDTTELEAVLEDQLEAELD